MNLIKSLMGRRQFLIATGVASTCALTCKKLAGFETRAVMAADKAATAAVKATTNRCHHLLSPLRIRNVVVKNRIMHTQSPPHCLQGPENFPADAYRNHYSNIAKNAAIVSVEEHFIKYPIDYSDTGPMSGMLHFSDHIWQDIPPVHNYLNRMIDDIHCEGALVYFAGDFGYSKDGTSTGGGAPGGGMPGGAPGGMAQGGSLLGGMQQGNTPGGQGGMPSGGGAPGGGASPQGGMQQGSAPGAQGGMPGGEGPQVQAIVSVKDLVSKAKDIEDRGYDVMALSANNLEAVQAVRSATNLLLIATGIVKVGSPGPSSGPSTPGVSNNNQPTADQLEQVVEAAKKLEGLADIIQLRAGSYEHPNSFTLDKERPFNLAFAEAIKKAGIKTVVCPCAGFHYADLNEQFIAGGKTDMVGMTMPFFADPEFVKKASEGRAEDIIPCISCHDCHGISRTAGPWYDVCTVNPKWATPAYKLANIPSPTTKKKVAVIGGGPGGMKAAVTAAERGHRVTLYEKGEKLGGLLQFTDHTQWKWTYRDFKDYLINQVKKAGIEVLLNTTATPEMIKSKGYDTVLVATGAEPILSRMAGADAGNVFNILTAYSNKKALGRNVALIGAGRIGTECAIGMAKDGHKVTVLAGGKEMIESTLIGPHNMSNQEDIYKNHPNISYILETTVKGITGGKVTYADSTGSEQSVQADSIVIYSGLKPMMDEASRFIGSADQVLLLGDCTGKNGTVQKTIRSAFFVASQV